MTTSTPPAWLWLSECDVPVEAPELSFDTPKTPVAATLGAQTDSDQCANGEQCPPSALIPSDQCNECRAAPGQPHATGCESAAQLTDAQSDAVKTHPAWVCNDCGQDRYGYPNAVSTWHMGICGICGETVPVTEPRDFGGYHSVAPTADFYTAAAHVSDARLGPGGGDVSCGPVISCDRKHDNLYDEPSLVKVESCPERGVVTDICDEVRYPDEWTETGNPLHAHMRQTFDACLAISVAKNADYASSSDPLANFRACQQFGVSLTRGIMVRLSDKFARIGNLLDNEAQVKDEAIADSIDDAVNYLAILKYAMEVE